MGAFKSSYVLLFSLARFIQLTMMRGFRSTRSQATEDEASSHQEAMFPLQVSPAQLAPSGPSSQLVPHVQSAFVVQP